MTTQDEQSLKNEIQHIFYSGANEIRIFEMVKSFIEKRGQALYIHDVSNSVRIALLEQLEELSEHIPCEVYTKKVIEIKSNFND